MPETHGSDYLLLEQLLGQCDSEVSAAEADGRLSGLAALLGEQALPVWLQQLVAAPDASSEAAYRQLLALAGQRLGVLQSAEALPVLSLPDDDDDLRDRVDALVLWSTGFLSGIGEGAALRGTTARERLQQAPMDELLRDLAEITQVELSEADIAADANAAETALAEIVEFLRVANQLTFETLADVRESAPPASDSVH